jgi:hypothetical protein
MVEKIWKGLSADIASLRPRPALIMQGSSPQQVQPQHQPQDARPLLPLWCALVTRIVNLSSIEAKCDGARAALDKERDGLMKANTFDMNNPREYSDLMRDNKIDEAMFGRVFMILGKKNAEMDERDEQTWKARAVFQGGNIRTKSGADPADSFREVANAPASIVAARAALATAVLRQLRVSFRDAKQAFLQSVRGKDFTPTWAELPKSWWPDAWYFDGKCRQRPRYTRPMVLMLLCLYGHPESGAIWENDLDQTLVQHGFQKVKMWPGVYCHMDDYSIFIVYVDDLMLAASCDKTLAHWRSLEKFIEFKDEEASIDRYLGAYHRLQEYDSKRPLAVRTFSISIADYAKNAVAKFVATRPVTLKKVSTPYVEDDENIAESVGVYASSYASHAAALLFLARVCRPDLSTIVPRLCSNVTRWTTTDDRRLIRTMAYIESAGDLELFAKFSPSDLDELVLQAFTDADWAGNPDSTKSTSGLWIRLFNPSSGNSWQISWNSRAQSHSASCTAEAEVVAFAAGLSGDLVYDPDVVISMSTSVRQEALPIQLLFEVLLGRRLPLQVFVDNTQCISAVEKGYSKKRRHLARTHRVSIGVLHELLEDEDAAMSIAYCETAAMLADSFTKGLPPASFMVAKKAMGLQAMQ